MNKKLQFVACLLFITGALIAQQYAPKDTLALQFENKTHLPAKVWHMVEQGDYLFASTSEGVWRSDDEGQYWTQKLMGGVTGLAATDSVVLASTYRSWVEYNPTNGTQNSYHTHTIHVSTDGGENFINPVVKTGFGSLFTSETYTFRDLQIRNDSTYFFYLHYSTWGNTNGVWIWTEDYGQTWEEQVTNDFIYDAIVVSADTLWGIRHGLIYNGTSNQSPLSNWSIPDLGQGATALRSAFYRAGRLYIQYASGHVLRSTDGMLDWEVLPELHNWFLSNQPRGIVQVREDGAYLADDPDLNSWTSIWTFTMIPNVRSFFHGIFALEATMVAQTAGGLLNVSTDQQQTWAQSVGISSAGDYRSSFQFFAGKYWVNAFDGTLLESDDFYHWTLPVNSNYLSHIVDLTEKEIHVKTKHQAHFYVLVGTTNKLLRSADGLNWETVGPDLSDYNVFTFQSDGDQLYLLAKFGNDLMLFSSDDHFESWEAKPLDFQLKHFTIVGNYWFGIDWQNHELLRSGNEGLSWDTLLNDQKIQSFSVKSDGTLLALTEKGEAALWRSTDTGQSWEQSGLPLEHFIPDNDRFVFHQFDNNILQIRHQTYQVFLGYLDREIILTGDDGARYTAIGLPPGVPFHQLVLAEDHLFSTTVSQLWQADSLADNLLFELYPKDTLLEATQVCFGDWVNGVSIQSDTVFSDWVNDGSAYHWTVNEVRVVDLLETQFQVAICESETYTWNGMNYTDAGNFEQLLISQNGCDSLVTLDLMVRPVDTVEWMPALCPGESIEFNGNIYDAFNSAGVEVLENASANGCDSVLQITVVSLPAIETMDSITLTAGTSYQGIPIYSDTTIVVYFTAANGCDSLVTTYISTLTSVQHSVVTTPGIDLFPNPAHQDLTLDLSMPREMEMSLYLMNSLGQKVQTISTKKWFKEGEHRLMVDVSSLDQGIYWLVVATTDSVWRKGWVKGGG